MGERCSLLRSGDRGVSWVKVASTGSSCVFAFDPSSPQVVYGMGSGILTEGTPGFYKSTDGGITWRSTSNNIQHVVRAVRFAADGRIYAIGWATSVSFDKGAMWTRLTEWPQFGSAISNVIAASDLLPIHHPVYGDDYVLVATDNGLYESADGARTLQPVGLQGFSLSGPLAVESTTPSGDASVAFNYRGGIALFNTKDRSIVPLQNGLPAGVAISAFPGGRYATGQGGLYVCYDLATCIGGTLPRLIQVVEFYNSILGHYFITASVAEAAGIDAGAAGPGWSRTGSTFSAYSNTDGTTDFVRAVCRFYGTPGRGPNSHFFTVDPGECERVKSDPGWMIETTAAFIIYPPVYTFFPDTRISAYDCGTRLNVYRLYNNGFARGDTNHRYTIDLAIYSAMQAKGWVGEGVRLCAARV